MSNQNVFPSNLRINLIINLNFKFILFKYIVFERFNLTQKTNVKPLFGLIQSIYFHFRKIMGGNESKKSQSNKTSTAAKVTNPPKGKMQSNIQHVLLLYKAEGKKQLDLVDAFQDALVLAGDPRIDVLYDINIAKDESSVKDVEWLNQENNVILIRLSPDVMEDLGRIIREKKFVGNDNVIHDKIVAVSFGKDFPQGWPPRGMKRRVCDHQKDFCFEFEDESLLIPGGFKTANAKSTMNAIVTALLAIDDGN